MSAVGGDLMVARTTFFSVKPWMGAILANHWAAVAFRPEWTEKVRSSSQLMVIVVYEGLHRSRSMKITGQSVGYAYSVPQFTSVPRVSADLISSSLLRSMVVSRR